MASRWYPYTTSHSYLPHFNTVIRDWSVFKRVAAFIHSAQEPPYTAHCGRIRPYSLGAKPNVCCSSYSPITGLVSCQVVAAKAANAIPLHNLVTSLYILWILNATAKLCNRRFSRLFLWHQIYPRCLAKWHSASPHDADFGSGCKNHHLHQVLQCSFRRCIQVFKDFFFSSFSDN